MNLQQTIEDLEKQAAQYTEAANTLKALLSNENASNGSARSAGKAAAARGTKSTTGQSNNRGNKTQAPAKKSAAKPSARTRSTVSPETRAKISAAIKASHERKKAAAA